MSVESIISRAFADCRPVTPKIEAEIGRRMALSAARVRRRTVYEKAAASAAKPDDDASANLIVVRDMIARGMTVQSMSAQMQWGHIRMRRFMAENGLVINVAACAERRKAERELAKSMRVEPSIPRGKDTDADLVSAFWHRTRRVFVPQIADSIADRMACSRDEAIDLLVSASRRGLINIDSANNGRTKVSVYEVSKAGRLLMEAAQ